MITHHSGVRPLKEPGYSSLRMDNKHFALHERRQENVGADLDARHTSRSNGQTDLAAYSDRASTEVDRVDDDPSMPYVDGKVRTGQPTQCRDD
jgi:hypothetical protein